MLRTPQRIREDDVERLMSMDNLALQDATAQRLMNALPRLEQTLELRKVTLGLGHPSTLKSMNNLAKAFKFAGRLAEALLLYEQTFSVVIDSLGPEHPHTLAAMAYLTQAHLAAEQPAKALPLFDRFITTYRVRAAPVDLSFSGMLIAASAVLLRHHQYETAETYLRECLMIREQQLPDDWRLFNARSTLGGALAGQKRFQEAEPLLIEGYFGMKEHEAQIPPAAKHRLPEAIQRLVDLYVAWEKPEQANEWQKRLDQTKTTINETEPTPAHEPTK